MCGFDVSISFSISVMICSSSMLQYLPNGIEPFVLFILLLSLWSIVMMYDMPYNVVSCICMICC